MERVLIVKTSSIGDVIQTFPVAGYLKSIYPEARIDWIVKASYVSLVTSHVAIDTVISCPDSLSVDFLWNEEWRNCIRILKQKRYDVVFDLQGNTKSMLLTFLARSEHKVGFGRWSVAEWPNILATNQRFSPPVTQNIRYQYLDIVRKYFQDLHPYSIENISLKITEEEKRNVLSLYAPCKKETRIGIGMSSRWNNKKLAQETWIGFLQYLEQQSQMRFFFLYGNEDEKKDALEISTQLKRAAMVDPMSFSSLHFLLSTMDVFIGVDSFILHFCGTTNTPVFGIFGPSRYKIYLPTGGNNFAFQGICPYGEKFEKRCSLLRKCATGRCMKDIKAEDLIDTWNNFSLIAPREDLNCRA